MYNFNEYPFTLTVTDAERIASLHENDENWDFWEFIKLSELIFCKLSTRFSTHNSQER